eukprot:scaffold28614_cov20-Tisochrysis_lutea.AAC.1
MPAAEQAKVVKMPAAEQGKATILALCSTLASNRARQEHCVELGLPSLLLKDRWTCVVGGDSRTCMQMVKDGDAEITKFGGSFSALLRALLFPIARALQHCKRPSQHCKGPPQCRGGSFTAILEGGESSSAKQLEQMVFRTCALLQGVRGTSPVMWMSMALLLVCSLSPVKPA